MKFRFTIFLLLILVATASAFAQDKTNKIHYNHKDINIKGIYIGMTKDEFNDKFANIDLNNFTIGGAPNKYAEQPLDPEYDKNNKLVRFVYFFHPNFFDDVKFALKNKYPALKCNNSSVSNAMGASFQQIICTIDDNISMLAIKRFAGDINTSGISISSKKFFNEESTKKLKAIQQDM